MNKSGSFQSQKGANMKLSLILIALFSIQAMAKESEQVLHEIRLIQVASSLRCVVEAGDENSPYRTLTEYHYKAPGSEIIFGNNHAELTHTSAYQRGCDIQKLDQIVESARDKYGFVRGSATLKKKLEPSFINGFKECVAHYTETMTLKFAGLELSSEQRELRKMNDCTN